MTPDEFIAKWQGNTRPERAAYVEHFNDLCRLLGEATPNEADPRGNTFAFEKGATQANGRKGWADVWKARHFAIEYKGRGKDLTAAFAQLQRYALPLGSPPLLVVCDFETWIIRTAWTNTVSETITIALEELRDPRRLSVLKALFAEPERLKPGQTREALTEGAAAEFAELAARLRARGHDAQAVAHFIQRIVFCLFADDVGLLPPGLLDRMLATARRSPSRFEGMASRLFAAMKDPGGEIDFTAIEWFNGGLFDDAATLPLNHLDIELLQRVARLDWSEMEPSIFGTLFERGLDPEKRGQLGAHYTDRAKIDLIVEPVVIRPLSAAWDAARARIEAAMARAADATLARGTRTRAREEAGQALRGFLDRLRRYRVLDPACGSGNFLYVALLAIKDLEHRAMLEAEALGLQREFPQVGPEVVRGIEINAYAAELARVVVWIGAIQWARHNAMPMPRDPVLKPLAHLIECRDAVLTEDGQPAAWPEADAIVGNPPFIGANMMVRALGEDYVARLRAAYDGLVPGAADFVCFWFDRAEAALAAGPVERIGLVATQAIRTGSSRVVLDRIVENGVIFDAWDNEPWTVEGADVRVAVICFGRPDNSDARYLDGQPVERIHADLSSGAVDFTQARRLVENQGACFQGFIAAGNFDVPGDVARAWLAEPANPNGRGNAEVVKRWVNARDLLHEDSDTWIVDFGATMGEAEASMFVRPFAHAVVNVQPVRARVRRQVYRDFWWRFAEARPALRAATASLSRSIVTPKVARHRIFLWVPTAIRMSQQFYVFPREDDLFFGLLHSRFHEAWVVRLASRHGVGNDMSYTPTATFETFPFPEGLTPDIPAATAAAQPPSRPAAQPPSRPAAQPPSRPAAQPPTSPPPPVPWWRPATAGSIRPNGSRRCRRSCLACRPALSRAMPRRRCC